MPPRKRNDPKTSQLDTSKLVAPNEDTSREGTPIHDQLEKDLANAKPEDVTKFEEDDNPLDHVGDLADEAPVESKENTNG